MLLSPEPREFFAVALAHTSFLRHPGALVDAVGTFAVAAESGNGGLIFDWARTDSHEGDWAELATWGRFTRLSV